MAFSVTVVLSITLFLVVGLSGCDWFNTSVLGKPGKAELAERERQDKEKIRLLDSMRTAAAEKLAELQERDNKTQTAVEADKQYHIIVGSYEEQENADRMFNTFKSHGYNPSLIRMGDLTCVSAKSYDTLAEAERELENFLDLDYCPEDAWVYRKR